MSSKWNESGILRKKTVRENYDDLLVFGYACKLFRDDEKALYIDQGKHLIPWMGDDRLKIDRYDGRGTLSDLSSCEASREGYDTTRWLDLSESERKVEQLCDEYRYYYLHNNEEEEKLHKEEDEKRKKANEFHYTYDVPKESDVVQEAVPTCEEEDKVFEPAPELDVPADIAIPKTVKENARIEKTAQFVSKQGPQMEILIKAKQADNPQFSFMNQTDPLYKYYRHLVAAIKCGRFKVTKEETTSEGENNSNTTAQPLGTTMETQNTCSSTTPSTSSHPSPPATSVLASKQLTGQRANADCAYMQLVSRIKGHHVKAEELHRGKDEKELQEEYYKYYQAQYYEYYKQIVQRYANQASCEPQVVIQNVQLQEQIQAQAAHFAQIACVQWQQEQQQQHQHQQQQNQQQTHQQQQHQQQKKEEIMQIVENKGQLNKKTVSEVQTKKPLLSLVHYSSDSEDQDEDDDNKETNEETEVLVPNEEIALIIEKMASYVSKNGADFERSVREKGDPRFEFLKENHKYYNFYKRRLKELCSDKEKSLPAKKRDSDAKVESKVKEVKEKRTIAPVSFSIKKAKEEAQKEIKSALPVEESDDEENATAKQEKPALKVLENKVIVAASSCGNNGTAIADNLQEIEPITSAVEDPVAEESVPDLDEDDPILEMIDLTSEDAEDKRLRRVLAEEKIKDKLAQAAKDKLLQTKKNNNGGDRASIQMERRKKAAMFLKMRKGDVQQRTEIEVPAEKERHREKPREKKHKRAEKRTRETTKLDDDIDDSKKQLNEEIYVEDSSSDNKSDRGERTHGEAKSSTAKRSKEKKRKKSRKRKSSSSRSSKSKYHHGKKSRKRRRHRSRSRCSSSRSYSSDS